MLRSPAPGTAVMPWGAEAHGNTAASLTCGLCCWEMGFWLPNYWGEQPCRCHPAWRQVKQFPCFHMHPKLITALEKPQWNEGEQENYFFLSSSVSKYFFLFNFLSQLNTLGNLKVFSIWYSSEKSYHQIACSFSSNIVHASAPASPSMVAAVWDENRNETLMVSYPVLLRLALAQPLAAWLCSRGQLRALGNFPEMGQPVFVRALSCLCLEKAEKADFYVKISVQNFSKMNELSSCNRIVS